VVCSRREQGQDHIPCARRHRGRARRLCWCAGSHAHARARLTATTGGLYYHTGITIAGFQSRVGCLFFLVRVERVVTYRHCADARQGALIAFSTLSALYSVVESRPLFVRERSNGYYRSARTRTHASAVS
jgi:hypothetical protein